MAQEENEEQQLGATKTGQRLPEVEVYLKAWRKFYDSGYGAGNRDRMELAWKGLEKSKDPWVRWISKHCHDYQHEATIVLEALPCTVEELDDLAVRQGFCTVWEDMKCLAWSARVLKLEIRGRQVGRRPRWQSIEKIVRDQAERTLITRLFKRGAISIEIEYSKSGLYRFELASASIDKAKS